ncbi:hypothetical protein [Cysteiniphilum halobium]|uniref:hypothetical protein n=1 Tax=Cysteiniphilum halobium TaxID=2219059 RepID=UPI003F87F1CE
MKKPAHIITRVYKDESGKQKLMHRQVGYFEEDDNGRRLILDGFLDFSRIPRDENGNLIIIERNEALESKNLDK